MIWGSNPNTKSGYIFERGAQLICLIQIKHLCSKGKAGERGIVLTYSDIYGIMYFVRWAVGVEYLWNIIWAVGVSVGINIFVMYCSFYMLHVILE